MTKLCSLLLFLLMSASALSQDIFTLQGTVRNPNRDYLTISFLDEPSLTKSKTIRAALSQGKFELKIPLQRPTLIQITDGINYLNGAVEPGQSLLLGYDASAPSKPELYGSAAPSFNFINQLSTDGINAKVNRKISETPKTPEAYDILLHYIDSIQQHFTRKLDSIRPALSGKLYQFLLSEVKGTFLFKRYNAVSSVDDIPAHRLFTSNKTFTTYTRDYLQTVLTFDDGSAVSPTYVSNVGNILSRSWDSVYNRSSSGESLLRRKYDWLTSLLTPKLRMPVLANLIGNDLATIKENEDIEPYIALMGKPMIGFDYREDIRKKYRQLIMIQKGQPAFDFKLTDENGQMISLSSLRGKVVYMDFWYAGCMPCLSLFERLKPVKSHFRNDTRVVFLSISVDDVNTWKKSLAKLKLDGLHLNAGDESASRNLLKRYQVYSYPTTYLIDVNGNVANADPPGPDDLIGEIEKWLPATGKPE